MVKSVKSLNKPPQGLLMSSTVSEKTVNFCSTK